MGTAQNPSNPSWNTPLAVPAINTCIVGTAQAPPHPPLLAVLIGPRNTGGLLVMWGTRAPLLRGPLRHALDPTLQPF